MRIYLSKKKLITLYEVMPYFSQHYSHHCRQNETFALAEIVF